MAIAAVRDHTALGCEVLRFDPRFGGAGMNVTRLEAEIVGGGGVHSGFAPERKSHAQNDSGGD